MLDFSWVTAMWSAAIAACLTLAYQNVWVWAKDRTAHDHIWIAAAMLGTAGFGVTEILLMRADTVERYSVVMRWGHVPVAVVVVALVVFVRVHLRAGRPWLLWIVIGHRVLILVVNFLAPLNVNYTKIVRLRPVRLFGETVSMADGIPSRWDTVAGLNTVLMLAFLIDAAVTVWRRGERRRAVIFCGSMIFFTFFGVIHPALIHARKVDMPYLLTFGFLGITAAMSYELAADVLRARSLAADLRIREAEARESEERLSLAIRGASLAIWIWDVRRDDFWMSPEMRVRRGFGASERVTLARMLDTVHPDDRETVRESMERACAGQDDFEREYRVAPSGGRMYWVAARASVERDAAGDALRMRGVSLDITARKAAEAEMLLQRDELAHLSRVTMVGELSGSLAHELNQPLTAILSNAQAAQRHLAGPSPDLAEVQEILKDIVSEDRRAGEVIRRLRALLRKGEVSQQSLDLAEVVGDVLKITRSVLVSKSVAVTIDAADGLPAVVGDRVQLQQVLLNLVVNGCDAMEGIATPEERRLAVRVSRDESGGVRVSVADRGPGIPEEKLASVFEPFYTTKAHGLGLGLAVCRTIISVHGGRIWAENNPDGRGATVHFTIPFAAEGA